ncbi:MAG: DnaA/Hda family protein [Pseudomonadota bacterium]|nr:DnaA/Hda family protein [Pseudomonadota bacterium]
MNQLVFSLPHRSAMGEEDFLVSPANAAAVAWLDAWPDWPAPVLVLHGSAGSGKTHLAHVWQMRSHAEFLDPDMLEHPDRLRDMVSSSPRLILDYPPVLSPAAQQGLFHLYQLLVEKKGSLLILARTPPAQWPLVIEDARSRLLAAPSAALEPPDDSLLAAVLVKLFSDRQIRVEESLIRFLVRHMERSFDAARRTVEALDQAALAAKSRVTLPLARSVLEKH